MYSQYVNSRGVGEGGGGSNKLGGGGGDKNGNIFENFFEIPSIGRY